ncbi:YihY/virulence factor BrkB family protein [Roseobacteraceae bacterium NS-SX3]
MRKTPPLKSWPRAMLKALSRFNRKNGWVMSSHIAMSMMLALFPFVLFTVALAGAIANVLSRDMNIGEMVDLVIGGWPEEISGPILIELYAVVSNSSTQLMTVGGLLALYFASNGVDAVRVAMVNAYHEEDLRPYWKARLICLGMVVLGGAGLMAATVFELVLPLYAKYLASLIPHAGTVDAGQGWVRQAVKALVPLGAVTAAHLVLPGQIRSLRMVLPGAVLTVVLWWAVGAGFAAYVGNFARYSATYAGLAGAMAALIFLYLNAAILVLGAEFNGALMQMNEQGEMVAKDEGKTYGA